MSVHAEYPQLDNWPTRTAGQKPKINVLRAICGKGLARPGTKGAVAVAMALRPEGTTQSQITAVLGGPYRNKLTQLCKNKKAALTKHQNGGRAFVYKLEIKD